MRHAVMAVAVAFSPHLRAVRAPVTMTARGIGRVMMAYLDRRRRVIDAK